MQIARFRYVCFFALSLSAMASCVWAANRSSKQPTTTLVTQLGDRLPGHWLATDSVETIAWQVPGFVGPFQIAEEQLASIQFQHQAKAPTIKGTYRCELVGGHVLFGNPLQLDNTELVFEVPGSGALKIERSHLRKLSPWIDSGQEIATTPIALDDWKGEHANWQKSSGRITALKKNAELTTSLPLGEKSQISLRIAWEGLQGVPDFRIDFGSNSSWDNGFRIETWQNRLVFVAESPNAANVLLVTKTVNHAGELRLNVFFDAEKETVLVTTDSGETLGQFEWNESLGRYFRILAHKKGLHFYHATVTPWDGSSPDRLDTAESRVHYKNGKSENATLTGWDAKKQEWTLTFKEDSPVEDEVEEATEETQEEVTADEVDEGADGEEAKDEHKEDNEAETKADEKNRAPIARQVASTEIVSFLFANKINDEQTNAVQVVSRTGMRFSGEITKLEEQAIELRCRGINGPVVFPLTNLRSLVFLKQPEAHDTKKVTKLNKFPRLQLGDASIGGQLVSGKGNDQATALVWKPKASKNASAISHKASGSVTYRIPPPPKKKTSKPQPARRNNGFFGGLARILGDAETRSSKKPTKLSSEPTLHLRSGDSIPCQPKRIDSQGVTFTSAVTEATFAPLESIKALVLVSNFKPAQVTQEQRDRLLTLPRMQQEYPPTHLLLSVDGDLLRTRVTAMDDKHIHSEVRLNAVKIPRGRVAAIAWLHEEKLEKGPGNGKNEKDTQEKPNAANPFLRVQAVQSDGIRLTFRPQTFDDGVLSGKSDIFGNCRVEVAKVDQLLFGQAIFEALKKQSHQLLALKPAIVPRFVTAESDAPSNDGRGSVLVGKKAPPIKLKKLDGTKFDLTDHRGKVVVLDFWATWCGPCIQWMPQLEEIVANYPEQEVQLVTINLLQEKEVVLPALERMQIHPTVLLDLDGVVTDAYQATAIPQTVIIDQQGKVVRLFIGGSQQIKQPLIEALDALTSRPAAN